MKKLVKVLGSQLSFNDILTHLGGAGQTLSHIINALITFHFHSVSPVSPPARLRAPGDTGGHNGSENAVQEPHHAPSRNERLG